MQRTGFTIWFTGLPSSGKTTLACLLQKKIQDLGFRVEHLDGDEVRQKLTKDLGFSKEDRDENIRRIAYVAKLISRVGGVAITSAISPYRALREHARNEIDHFVEVFVDCPVDVCIQRDVKGLYKKALKGEISQFTGVSDPYEPPLAPEVIVKTNQLSPEDCIQSILHKLEELGYLAPSSKR